MTLRRVPFVLAASCAGFLGLAVASLVLPGAWRIVPLVGLVLGASCYARAWARLLERRAAALAVKLARQPGALLGEAESPQDPLLQGPALDRLIDAYGSPREIQYALAVVEMAVDGDATAATARAARLAEHVEARRAGRPVRR